MVAIYHLRLKKIWDDLENYQQLPGCEGGNCSNTTAIIKEQDEEKYIKCWWAEATPFMVPFIPESFKKTQFSELNTSFANHKRGTTQKFCTHQYRQLKNWCGFCSLENRRIELGIQKLLSLPQDRPWYLIMFTNYGLPWLWEEGKSPTSGVDGRSATLTGSRNSGRRWGTCPNRGKGHR